MAARMMRSHKSGLIGVITGAISTAKELTTRPAGLPDLFILQGVQQMISQSGMTLMIADTDGRPDRVAPGKDTVAIRRAARHHTPTSRRAYRCRRMKLVKAHPNLRHRVKVRRLYLRMPVVSHVPPALIIRHHQHDVGWSRRDGLGSESRSAKKSGEGFHAISLLRIAGCWQAHA